MAGTQDGAGTRDRLRRAAADYGGWIAVAVGAVLCVLGWYGVSGERFAERQIPFLASATIPGAALIVAGAVLLAGRPDPGTAARVEQLHRQLVKASPGTGEAPGEAEAPKTTEASTSGRPVPEAERDGGTGGVRLAVPGGTVHHRPGCPLVEGRPEAREVDEDEIRDRALAPCPMCG
jgi:hypothetical protein